jgi:hypothetical protein
VRSHHELEVVGLAKSLCYIRTKHHSNTPLAGMSSVLIARI